MPVTWRLASSVKRGCLLEDEECVVGVRQQEGSVQKRELALMDEMTKVSDDRYNTDRECPRQSGTKAPRQPVLSVDLQLHPSTALLLSSSLPSFFFLP
jgi:hypothetical protein